MLSAVLGSLTTSILDNIMQNIWIPRICGMLVAGLVGLILYVFLNNKKGSNPNLVGKSERKEPRT